MPVSGYEFYLRVVRYLTSEYSVNYINTRLSKKSFVGIHMARTTSRDFVARGRPLRGQKRLAPLAKRSTCSKSKPSPAKKAPPLLNKLDLPLSAVRSAAKQVLPSYISHVAEQYLALLKKSNLAFPRPPLLRLDKLKCF